jgi:uncharacterized membrane protein YbhN (UPF0104 family)
MSSTKRRGLGTGEGGQWLRLATIAFYIVLAAMLVSVARKLDMLELWDALQSLPGSSIRIAALCSLLCYFAYAGYEILAARTHRLALPAGRVGLIGFVSYACNLSLGAVLGALGVRIKLYIRQGVAASDALVIVALNLLTNWSGYLAVLGVMLLSVPGSPPASWSLSSGALKVMGWGSIVVFVCYIYACVYATRRTWSVRGQRFELPTGRIAAAQLCLSIPMWLLTSANLAMLLGGAAFHVVAIALLGSALIGLVIRLPAGLGVLEGVFLVSFSNELGSARVLAALIAFRCIHYVIPLIVGLMIFCWMLWKPRNALPHEAPLEH